MALADEILAAVPGVVKRKTWWDELSEEAVAELLEVRKRFQAGEYGTVKRYQLAEILFKRCQARGWRVCDPRRFAVWLAKND